MVRDHPAGRLLLAAAYTLRACERALVAQALGGGEARIHAIAREWSRELGPRLGVTVRAHGFEHVDWSRTYVVMANHASYLDVLALYASLPKVVGFVAKKELRRIPLFGGAMDALGCVVVDRGRHREAVEALDEAADEVRRGRTIAVFPEGTRSRGDRILPLKRGPFHLVQRAQVEVLPVGIRGAGAIMPRENTAIHPGVIEVFAGAPLPPPPMGDAGARRALLETTRAELSRLAAVPMAG